MARLPMLSAHHCRVPARAAGPAPTSAVSAFLAAKAEFDRLLAELAAASEDHFGVDPDRLHWGHVGDMAARVAALRPVADALAGRGEFAPAAAPAAGGR